tara:strand:- start:94560 stop:95465 length:906 start_codon:yes stop_codon:yes gene_type:complete
MKPNKEYNNDTDIIGNYAALLGIVEVGLGSFLHAFKIPFSGQFLSLNQLFILTIAYKQEQRNRTRSAKISLITSLLKTLSPAGKKLTPMLAITCQGFLHSLGLILFGTNIIGLLIGGMLLSLWSFIQPFLIYILLFGKDLLYMVDYFVGKLNRVIDFSREDIVKVVFIIISIKVILSIFVTISALRVDNEFLDKYLNFLKRFKKESSQKKTINTPMIGVIKDITSPLFLLSFIFMGIFYYYSSHDLVSFIWNLLRPFALAIILFYIMRVVPIESINSSKLLSKFPQLQKSLSTSLEKVKEF